MILAALLLAQAAAAPPSTPAPAAVLQVPARYRLVEGIAADGDTIWFSSVIDRRVIALRRGKYTDYPIPDGLGAPLGIAWDRTRGWLWIAANCPDGLVIAGCRGAALIGMDRRGKVRATLRPADPERFTPGDVSVWQGRVFVSDSQNGGFYGCSGRCEKLAPIVAPRADGSAQGSAVYDDGNKVLLADYGLGILSIDLATGVETRVLREDGRPLQGVDGLVAADDGSFLAVRNAAVPGNIVRFRVRDGKIVDLAIAAAGGAIHDPTQLTRAGGRVLIVGDAQWAAYLPDKDGKRSGVQVATPIVAIPAN